MADAEARLAIPFPGAYGAVFRHSWGYLGPLGCIFGCLGAVLGALGSSWDALGGILGDLRALVERLVHQVDVRFALSSMLDAKWAPKGTLFRSQIRALINFGREKGAKREAFGEPK